MKITKYLGILSVLFMTALVTTTTYAFSKDRVVNADGVKEVRMGMRMNRITNADKSPLTTTDIQGIRDERISLASAYLGVTTSELKTLLETNKMSEVVVSKGHTVLEFREYMRPKMVEYMTSKGYIKTNKNGVDKPFGMGGGMGRGINSVVR